MYDPIALAKAIGSLVPLAQYSNEDGTYEGIIWNDERPMPSKAAIEAAMSRVDVPAEVWKGAMIRAMHATGIAGQVKELVASSGDELLQDLYAGAAAFRRDDPMVAMIGAAVDPPWSEQDLDDLFRLAGSFNT